MGNVKTFKFFEEKGLIKMQIGDDKFVLDNAERKRINNLLKKSIETSELVPNAMNGVLIMYDNGLIAANISIGKLDLAGTQFLLVIYSLTPKSTKYDVNTFLLQRNVMEKYIKILS